MGTRLYPNTNNDNILEILAGASKGTMERLSKTQENHKQLLSAARERGDSIYDLEHELWCEIHEDSDMGTLDSFITFGWGKLRTEVYDLLKTSPNLWDGELYDGGSCNDSELCAKMLVAQGVDPTHLIANGISPKDLGGLSWG